MRVDKREYWSYNLAYDLIKENYCFMNSFLFWGKMEKRVWFYYYFFLFILWHLFFHLFIFLVVLVSVLDFVLTTILSLCWENGGQMKVINWKSVESLMVLLLFSTSAVAATLWTEFHWFYCVHFFVFDQTKLLAFFNV